MKKSKDREATLRLALRLSEALPIELHLNNFLRKQKYPSNLVAGYIPLPKAEYRDSHGDHQKTYPNITFYIHSDINRDRDGQPRKRFYTISTMIHSTCKLYRARSWNTHTSELAKDYIYDTSIKNVIKKTIKHLEDTTIPYIQNYIQPDFKLHGLF